jgi:hypothetical protein
MADYLTRCAAADANLSVLRGQLGLPNMPANLGAMINAAAMERSQAWNDMRTALSYALGGPHNIENWGLVTHYPQHDRDAKTEITGQA